MIEGYEAQELAVLARSGASLEVDGSAHAPVDLCDVARSLMPGRELVVHNASSMFLRDMCQIARAAGTSVVRFV